MVLDILKQINKIFPNMWYNKSNKIIVIKLINIKNE